VSSNASAGWFFTILVYCLGGLSSCAPPAPPDSRFERAPQVSELAGSWATRYESKVIEDKATGKQYQLPAVETIILKEDGTYDQVFDDGKSPRSRSEPCQWRVRLGSDGKAYVSLLNMRYYLDGIEYAEAHPRNVDLIIEGSLSNLSSLALCDPYVDINLCYTRANP